MRLPDDLPNPRAEGSSGESVRVGETVVDKGFRGTGVVGAGRYGRVMSSSLAQRPTHPMVDALAAAGALLDDALDGNAWSPLR